MKIQATSDVYTARCRVLMVALVTYAALIAAVVVLAGLKALGAARILIVLAFVPWTLWLGCRALRVGVEVLDGRLIVRTLLRTHYIVLDAVEWIGFPKEPSSQLFRQYLWATSRTSYQPQFLRVGLNDGRIIVATGVALTPTPGQLLSPMVSDRPKAEVDLLKMMANSGADPRYVAPTRRPG